MSTQEIKIPPKCPICGRQMEAYRPHDTRYNNLGQEIKIWLNGTDHLAYCPDHPQKILSIG